MKDVLRLTRLFLNNHYGLSMLRYNRKHDSKAFFKQLGIPLIVILCLLPVYGLYILFCTGLFSGLWLLNQTSVLLPLVFTMVSLLIIIFGIAEVMSEFFFSDDVSMLLPLPLSQKSVLLGKYITMLVGEWVLTLLMMVPPVLIYGIGMKMSVIYYVMALLTVGLLPLLPIALETLIVMLLMRTSVLKGRKDLIQTVGLFVFLALIIGIQLVINVKLQGSEDPTQLVDTLLSDNGAMLKNVAAMYPPSLLAAGMLNTIGLGSVVNLVGFVLLSVAAILLMLAVGEKVYFRSLAENSESSGRKKRTKTDRTTFRKTGNTVFAVFKMDMRLLLRTPIYLYNNVSVVVLMPVIFAIMLFSSGAMNEAETFIPLYQAYSHFFIIGLTALFLFFGITSATTVSTFSREGKNIWLTQIVPVDPRDQIIGRSLSAFVLSGIGVILTLVLARWALPMTVLDMVLVLGLTIMGILPMLFGGLLIDLHRPMLKWDNPQKAVKNNLNVMFLLLLGLVWTAIGAGLMVVCALFLSVWIGFGLFILISGILSGVLYHMCQKEMESCLMNMSAE